MGKYVTKEMIRRAREMDLYSYMEIYEPDNLIHSGANQYRLQEHDSVVISNGLWCQKSTKIGGRSALDYLIKVRGIPFLDAVEMLSGRQTPKIYTPGTRSGSKPVEFRLPPPYKNNNRVCDYLKLRGISKNVIQYCIDHQILYEAGIHHNAVFVGMDYDTETPRYACQRGCNHRSPPFRGEVGGSLKQYSFRIENPASSTVHIHESPIDLMSYCTLLELQGKDWLAENQLSTGGVAINKETGLPLALSAFLARRQISTVVIHYDNDEAGRSGARAIMDALPKSVKVIDRPPPKGKDTNEYLCMYIVASRNRIAMPHL